MCQQPDDLRVQDLGFIIFRGGDLHLEMLHGCISPDDVWQSARSRPDVICHSPKIDCVLGVIVDPHRKVPHLPQHTMSSGYFSHEYLQSNVCFMVE